MLKSTISSIIKHDASSFVRTDLKEYRLSKGVMLLAYSNNKKKAYGCRYDDPQLC